VKRRFRLLVLAGLAATLMSQQPALATPASKAPPVVAVFTQWLRVSTGNPNLIFAGGTYRCSADPMDGSAYNLSKTCPSWIERSTDGGATWTDLSVATGATDPQATTGYGAAASSPPVYCGYALNPPVLDASAQQAALIAEGACYTASSGFTHALYSPDGGLHWPSNDVGYVEGGYGAGYTLPVFSLLPPHRLFAVSIGSQGDPIFVAVRDSRGWHTEGNPISAAGSHTQYSDEISGLVPDGRNPAGVFAIAQSSGNRTYVAHSDDLGKTWSLVTPPAGVTSFSVAADPFGVGGLVGSTNDAGVPADRRYYSGDGGATWTAGQCAGDNHGRCPTITITGGFGPNAYAFAPDGVHAFQGHGPSGPRLPITLPVPAGAVVSAASGPRAGDPLYLLASTVQGSMNGAIYRGTDRGATWVRLDPGVPPTVWAPAATPGSLLLKATDHSVAPLFVPLYKQLGIATIGYPIDEAYTESGVLTQDFQRLRLEDHDGRIVVAPLGTLDINYGFVPLGEIPSPYGPKPTLTVAQQAQAASFAAFWQSHGGKSILGMAISPPFVSTNDDGSGRQYVMQYYQNARIEAHPENKGTPYTIQLGLLGMEVTRARGWLP
jgi:hypothetical protein